ncbi:MAG: hypothetical protein DME89_00275 [Verrucomicrobia bacterium]|nr:MAG: hypothetical protein DMC60_12710 [Verrucomicrobiota bacterium]PYJ30471.1 MAG: hypothetical protein DME89_00275 [Verrucomicrobiota bacterium]
MKLGILLLVTGLLVINAFGGPDSFWAIASRPLSSLQPFSPQIFTDSVVSKVESIFADHKRRQTTEEKLCFT